MHMTKSIGPLRGRKGLFFHRVLIIAGGVFWVFLLTLKLLLQPHNSTSRRERSNIIILLGRWRGWALGKDPAQGKAAGSEENLYVREGRKRK